MEAAMETAWHNLKSWLDENCPEDSRRLQGPATADQVRQAQEELGIELFPDLLWLLAQHNGTTPAEPSYDHHASGTGEFLLGGYMLSPLDRIIDDYKRQCRFALEVLEEDGEEAYEDLYGNGVEHLVPFAYNHNALVMVIDHEPGPSFGRVLRQTVDGSMEPFVAVTDSLALYFERTLESLRQGTPFGGYRAEIHEYPSGRRSPRWYRA